MFIVISRGFCFFIYFIANHLFGYIPRRQFVIKTLKAQEQWNKQQLSAFIKEYVSVIKIFLLSRSNQAFTFQLSLLFTTEVTVLTTETEHMNNLGTAKEKSTMQVHKNYNNKIKPQFIFPSRNCSAKFLSCFSEEICWCLTLNSLCKQCALIN